MIIKEAGSAELVGLIHELFIEYAGSLHIDLYLYGFTQELAGLPGQYARPDGRLLLAFENDEAAGCIALRKLNENDCEMKRLYVRPKYRKQGIGRALTEAVIAEAKAAGYTRMLLDTFTVMKEAIGLHESLGFRKIEPYYYNPLEGAVFMALDLSGYLLSKSSVHLVSVGTPSK